MSNELRSLPVVDCWNTVGVNGTRTCPTLVEVIHCHNSKVFATAARSFLDRPAPPNYAREISRLFVADSGPAVAHTTSVVIFDLSTQSFAIETKAVVEVTEPRPIHRVGHRTGRVFSGITNVHGQLELCASLRGLLQIEDEPIEKPPQPRMLLVEHAGQRWVFAVDAVHGVYRFSTSDISDVPATSQTDRSYAKRVFNWQNRRVADLDLDRAFSALQASVH
jgi:chemotaxis-related protein WspD